MKSSRGFRNNNPLNIIKTQTSLAYRGVSKVQSDKDFLQFQSMAYGYRAAIKLLHRYYYKHNLRTVATIVARWCPDHTAKSYAQAVAKRMKVKTTEVLKWDSVHVVALLLAMTHIENGYVTDNAADHIMEAFKLLLDEGQLAAMGLQIDL